MFFYHSATKGMIRATLDAFFTAKSEGMNSEDALQFMILTRYSLFPKKREEFIRLYALFQLYLEDKISLLDLDDALHDFLPDTSSDALDAVIDAYGELIMVLRFHAPEIPNNIGEKEKQELEMLRGVISLMHMYESGAIFKTTESVGFPTVKFLDNFIYTIDQEYYKRVGKTSPKQESIADSKFKNREEYEAWKAHKIKENEEKRQSQKEIDIGKEPNQLKDAEKKTILLVDDDIHVHRLIDKEFPFRDKMDLVYFYSPKDAFNYLLTNKVHLIISCLLFPDITGIHFLRACKELCPKLPFIIHSGMDYRDDFAVWAADAYIIKSSDLSELFKTIEKLLGLSPSVFKELDTKEWGTKEDAIEKGLRRLFNKR